MRFQRCIRAISEEYVVRQVVGKQLLANVTQPLSLRIIGGTEKDIPDYRRKSLPKERDPVPHNGAAKDLFASLANSLTRCLAERFG